MRVPKAFSGILCGLVLVCAMSSCKTVPVHRVLILEENFESLMTDLELLQSGETLEDTEHETIKMQIEETRGLFRDLKALGTVNE